MKILFVGDPHLDSRTPISRADDYAEASLNKLEKILAIAKTKQVDTVIFAGDMFDKDRYDPPLSYMNKVLAVLGEYSRVGIRVYSVIGNHDLKHNKMEYFQNSPLNILFQADVVKHLVKEEQDNVALYGLDFTERDKIVDLVKDLDPNKLNILTMHYATDNTIPYESIGRDELQGFHIVMSGHDHNYYPHNTDSLPIVLRPGSMIRRTKDKYNLERTPFVYYFDTETSELDMIPISDKRAENIFIAEVFNPELGNMFGDINSLFNETYFKKEILSLEQLVEDLPISITQETRDKLREYFKSLGY